MTDKNKLPFRIPDDKIDSYMELKTINSDSCGTLIINAAERWAAAMEKEMEAGIPLPHAAETTEYQSVTRWDFTGSMYGFVIGTLGEFWEHGAEFLSWYEHRYDNSKIDWESVEEPDESDMTMTL